MRKMHGRAAASECRGETMPFFTSRRLLGVWAFAALALIAVVVSISARRPERVAAAPPVPPITVSVAVPTDLPTAPAAATLQQAGAFAWNEFIALNWAAVPQHGRQGQREAPNVGCKFGDITSAGCNGPLVWETLRNKVEIFPGRGNPPGYPGTSGIADPSLGFDALPQYNYASPVPSCTSPAPSGPTPFINLDETDQITVDEMYAGAAPTAAPNNSQPQLIRFLAKGNRTQYVYIAKNKWWGAAAGSTGQDAPTVNTAQYVQQNKADPPASQANTLVLLPPGTIEIKAAWRLLGKGDTPSRYRTATARYYELTAGASPVPCWNQATFALIALHIIQKTPMAPYFVYASFEQADNIRTAAGKPTEDDDGNVIATQPCAANQTSPCPTTPTETLIDGPHLQKLFAAPTPPAATPQPCVPGQRTYYIEEGSRAPRGIKFCVNSRMNPIPREIIQLNQAAHAAMRLRGAPNNVFLHYKLINVQYIPIDKKQPGPFTGNDPTTGNNPASFELANGVVETDRVLQKFSGGLKASQGLISDYTQAFGGSPPPATHQQVFQKGVGYDMGGCMGCHGSQGQSQGGDFSVITAVGSVASPEPPQPVPTAPGSTMHALAAHRTVKPIRNRHLVDY
jgi:hypothetical protein